MNRLADLRTTIINLDNAKETFNALERAELELEKADAAVEARIAALKQQHAERTAEQREQHAALAQQLRSFIETRRDLFREPRKVSTDLGTFGLQHVTDLVVTDEAAALLHVQARKLGDCFKSVTKLVLLALRKRLDKGEAIPGCAIRSGDTAVYRVAKALVEQERAIEE